MKNVKHMLNENIMIGTAILATFSEKKDQDCIDLMIPFVKYTLQEKYALGDVVSSNEVCDYIKATFAFENLPTALIDKVFIRLSKRNGCLSYSDKEYTFFQEVSVEHAKIKTKRNNALLLMDNIVKKLLPYINSRIGFRTYVEDDIKQSLFNFLDKYGLSTFQNPGAEYTISKQEQINRIIGSFILQEQEENSIVFQNLIDLMKGVFVSKALYLQTHNDNLFTARMKDTIIILDAPVLLKVLGLKTVGENRAAKELLQIIPPQVSLSYFYENFQELEGIISHYKSQRILGGKFTHTLEFFDENAYSIEDINEYLIQLDKKLRVLNINEYTSDIPLENEYMIDIKGLSQILQEAIPSYKIREKALEIDVKTISYINRLRRGHKPKTIEKCKALFITNNYDLVTTVNKYLNDENNNIGCVMSDIDFTILMWLKNSSKKENVPKDILVANAMAAVDEVTENFMTVVLDKIKKYQSEGNFDEENAGLILENIYCRRELVDVCNGDPQQFSIQKLQIVQDKYEDTIKKQAGFDNKLLRSELEKERLARIQAEQENEARISRQKEKAKTYANRIASRWQKTIVLVGIILFIAFGICGIIGCIIQGINGEWSLWGIAGILIAIWGAIDLICSKFKFIIKLSNFVRNKVYSQIYDKKIEELQ